MSHFFLTTRASRSASMSPTGRSQQCGTSRKNAAAQKALCAPSSGPRTRATSILLQAIQILAFLMAAGVGLGTTTAGCYDQLESPTSESLTNIQGENENAMPAGPGRQDVTSADIGAAAPITTLDLPANGGLYKAEDLRNVWAAAAKNNEYVLNDPVVGLANKVNRTGDTMTGTLTITPSASVNALELNAATDQFAASITGNGTAYAVSITAGASNGSISATSNNGAPTLEAFNQGAGRAANITGSTNASIPALGVATTTAQNATTPRMGISLNGFLVMVGTDPNPTVNPGADNAIHGANIPKTWARLASRPGDNDATRIKDGYNIASITTSPTTCDVLFVRPMLNDEYAVTITPMGGTAEAVYRTVAEATTGFTIRGKYLATGLDVDFQTDNLFDVGVHVLGRQ